MMRVTIASRVSASWVSACVFALGLSVLAGAVDAAPRPESPRRAPADTKAAKAPPPMDVFIVKSSDPNCEPNCPAWIAAQGTIRPGAVAKLKKVLKHLGSQKLPILIESPGGTVEESLVLGRLIRANGLEIVVAKTELQTCSRSDAICLARKVRGIRTGKPNAYLAVCASACAFTLAGGTRRIVGRASLVGVHEVASYRTTVRILQKYKISQSSFLGVPTGEKKRILISSKKVSEKTEQVKTAEVEYKKLAAYFSEMGIGSGINGLMRAAPHKSIHVLTREELTATKLATDSTSVDEVVQAARLPVSAAVDDRLEDSKKAVPQKAKSVSAARKIAKKK
jgi:hypothetical protein